jgi:glycine/D-amino acid oxidase-like deaminating enzyme
MTKHYYTVVIGGGCLGCACAFSISRQLGRQENKVAIIEKKVLGAGLSSRHSAIVRSANASAMAARMAKIATRQWKTLKILWGVDIPFEQPGAIWIAGNSQQNATNKWQQLEKTMQNENIALQMISRNEVTDLCNGAIRVDPDEIYFYEPDVLQLDSSEILNALQNAAKVNQVELIEHCQVYDFERDSHGNIIAVHTNQGKIGCQNIVNATGGWSSDLFASIGIHIPVALEPVYAGGYQSFFDITPDLKFILGKDTKAPNLFHCLGAGQALKYAPVFGEVIADLVTKDRIQDTQIDISEFSIARFNDKAISEFWRTETDNNHAL